MSHEYLMKHSQQLFEKFSGKYLPIIGEKVITASESGIEAFRRAKEKHPGSEQSWRRSRNSKTSKLGKKQA